MSIRPTTLALIAALSLAAPHVALSKPAPVAAQLVTSPAAAPAAQVGATDYAEREARDKQVAEFQGGERLYIAVSTGAAIIFLLILIILL